MWRAILPVLVISLAMAIATLMALIYWFHVYFPGMGFIVGAFYGFACFPWLARRLNKYADF